MRLVGARPVREHQQRPRRHEYHSILSKLPFQNLTQKQMTQINIPTTTVKLIEPRELHCSYTVGLVVEYSPATGETRVRFPDGVPVKLEFLMPLLCVSLRF